MQLILTRGTCLYTSASTAPALERLPSRVWTSGRSRTNSPRKRVVCGSCMIVGPPHTFFLVKFWTKRAQLEDGRFVYCLLRSPMFEYLVNFLHKLQQLPERYMMNSVLENLTILQVVTETPRNCCSALPTSLKSPPVSGGPSTTFIAWSGTEGGPQK